METILARQTDREFTVTVTREKFLPGWELYPIRISDGKNTITLSQYDIFPLVRLLVPAFDIIQKDEDSIRAAEAFPVEV